ncbi:C2 domain [Sesbania bispinosa]|nr:C2 domain [Sesbania bispinosa]
MDTNRTLELTVLSAEDLRVDRKLNAKNLYVVVRAESITSYTTSTVVTEYDSEDGGNNNNPTWNEKLLVDVPAHARCITLEVKYCKSSSSTTSSGKDIGVARIAVSDFLGGAEDHCLKMLSYRLRDWEGRRNGVLHFSVRVVKKEKKVGLLGSSYCGFQNIMMMKRTSSSSSSGGGVVTAIPVRWNNCASSNV